MWLRVTAAPGDYRFLAPRNLLTQAVKWFPVALRQQLAEYAQIMLLFILFSEVEEKNIYI